MMGDAKRTTGVSPPEVHAFNVYSDIHFRFARTLVVSKVINREDFSQELSFAVVLPQRAFITGFVMEINNTTYRSIITEKNTADAAYSNAVQSGKAGALLSYRDSNLFDISINIEGNKQVSFKLSYEELLKREYGSYRHIVTVNPGQVVPGMKVKVHIFEPKAITKIITPKFSINNIGVRDCSGANLNSTCVSDNEMVKKTSFSPSEVLLEFGISKQGQKKLIQGTGRGLSGQFEVLYDVERDEAGGEILVRDGYFIHFFAPPEGMHVLPKHIIFVLDLSGSMRGREIEQVKDAMRLILPTLLPDDLFNVIVFADYVMTWDLDGENDLVTEQEENPTESYDEILRAFPATAQNIETAINRVNNMLAEGGTNIFGALRQAVRTAQKQQSIDPEGRVPIIYFLTDGEANVGISEPDDIINELANINADPKIPIFSFSFGEGGNYTFLTKLSLANSGVAQLIYKALDATIQLQDVYKKISSAVLSNVTFRYLPDEVDLSSVTKLDYHTFFEGEEIVVSGRTIDKNIESINGEVSANRKGLKNKKLQVQSSELHQPKHKINASAISVADPTATKAGSMERAWAYLTIKQLIEKSKSTPELALEVLQQATNLAKNYSFASEVTSFVVVKPDGQRQVADIQRIPDAGDAPEIEPTVEPTAEEPDANTVNVTNLPDLNQLAARKLPVLRLYHKTGFGLHDITWLPETAKSNGYVDLLSRDGQFIRYTLLYDPEPLDPLDEPDCAFHVASRDIDKLKGKCRHLSQCVMRAIISDYRKYRDYDQCELNGYLAICCPH